MTTRCAEPFPVPLIDTKVAVIISYEPVTLPHAERVLARYLDACFEGVFPEISTANENLGVLVHAPKY